MVSLKDLHSGCLNIESAMPFSTGGKCEVSATGHPPGTSGQEDHCQHGQFTYCGSTSSLACLTTSFVTLTGDGSVGQPQST